MQYIDVVALESTYSVPTVPFTVKAVYGEFHNRNGVWVQLWRTAPADNDSFTYELVWQTLVIADVGDGNGEWVTSYCLMSI